MDSSGGRGKWPPSIAVLVVWTLATVYGAVNGVLAALDHRGSLTRFSGHLF
jgi:hypothetical protein